MSRTSRTRRVRSVRSRVRSRRVGGAGLLIATLLAGCGTSDAQSTGTAAEPTLTVPAATATPGPASEPAEPDEAVSLPWPAVDPAMVAELQQSADNGSQPWLLDPAEVAVSYATAAHGWTQAEALPHPDGRTVEVSEGGKRLTLTLAQPGRVGPSGIWVVVAEAAGG